MLRVSKLGDEFFIVRDLATISSTLVDENDPKLNAARAEFISELVQLTEAGEPVILIHEIADLRNFGVDLDKIIDLTKYTKPKMSSTKSSMDLPETNSDFINQILATLASWEQWWDDNFETIHQSNIADSIGYSKPPVLRWDSEFYRQTSDHYAAPKQIKE